MPTESASGPTPRTGPADPVRGSSTGDQPSQELAGDQWALLLDLPNPEGRPRTPIGTFGKIHTKPMGKGRFRARTRARDLDGQLRRVVATGDSTHAAEAELKLRRERLRHRSRWPS